MKITTARRRRLDFFDVMILIILAAMIVLSPLAMGSVAPWARSSLFVLSLATGALWLTQCAWRGRLAVKREPLLLFIVLFFAVAAAQLAPIGADTLAAVSPATADLYGRTLPAADAAAPRTLSLTPYATAREIQRFAAFALVFLVIAHTFRTRLQVTVLILAAVAMGTFEAVYGFAEHFSGAKQIFWNEKEFCRLSVSGTFVNKNHFAGFLEMIIPMALGLCMAAAPPGLRGGNLRARIVDTVSSSGLHRQIILGALIVIMTLAIFLSLSRAGISCTVVAWIPFFLFIGLATGTRKYTMIVLLLILAAICVFLGAHSELTIEKMEEAATGESVSLYGRLDLWSSAAGMVRDFPLFGTGLGSFEAAFERYQSPYFGDKIADYAHNDWLQIFCETGLAGGLAAAGGMVLLFVSLTRRTVGRRDSFCRWIATGAMAGCGAMLAHSFFDFNLYKITSNGLLFAVTLGIWYVAANMKGRTRGSRWKVGEIEIPLRARPLRTAFAAAALAGAAMLSVQPVRAAAADIHFNRYLASLGAPSLQDRYFFLPLEQSARADAPAGGAAGAPGPARGGASVAPRRSELERARKLDPRNPLMVFFEGIDQIAQADTLARERAAAMLDEWFDGISPADEAGGADALNDRLFDLALVELSAERQPILRKAENRLEEAVRLAPTASRYHLALANVRGEAGLFAKAGADGMFPGAAAARAALWLAPCKPWVLYHTGRLHLARALSEAGSLDADPDLRAFVADCFRRAIAADPQYAERIFALVLNRMGGTGALAAVTPDTSAALQALIDRLWALQDWKAALAAIDRLEALCAVIGGTTEAGADEGPQTAAGSPKSAALLGAEAAAREKGSAGRDDRDLLDVRIESARQRAAALAMLGRFDERRREARRLTELLRLNVADDIERAAELRAAHRYRQAFDRILAVLSRDWSNPDALLFAAESALMPGMAEGFPAGNGGLDHLFRLIIHNKRLEPRHADRARALIAELHPRPGDEERLCRLIDGAVLVLSDRPREGAAVLQSLATELKHGADLKHGAEWDNRHLVWFYLGLAGERCGRTEDAVVSYARVLQDVPSHRGALERLAALDPGFQLSRPQPAVLTDIDFGGRAHLVGYSLGPERLDPEPLDQERWITLYWQVTEPAGAGCAARLQLLDGELQTLYEDNRAAAAGAPTALRCGAMILDRRPMPKEYGPAEYIRLRVRPADAPHLATDSGDRECLLPIAGL